MHGDEAVHAWKINELATTWRYVYDPHEFHGPALYYLTLPVFWLGGLRDWTELGEAGLRIVPALCGAALLPLTLLIRDGLGRAAVAWAVVFAALSPALVFYSRYYIPETLLVLAAFVVLAAGWRYARSRRAVWLILAGAGVGLMHATKETCVLSLAALAAALGVESALLRRGSVFPRCGGLPASCEGGAEGLPASNRVRIMQRGALAWHAAGAGLAGVAVSVTLYSAFFTNPRGPLDSILTYVTYWQRGTGAEGALHHHPWHYYLMMLLFTKYPRGPVWSEGLTVLLAGVGCAAAFARRPVRGEPSLARLLASYTLALTAIYSAIPYKTPWCLLSFLHGMALMAGFGAAALFDAVRARAVRAALLVVLAGGLVWHGWQSWQAAGPLTGDRRNPYVYAHPLPKIRALAERVEAVAAVHPDGRAALVKVICPDPWPLPWYLRRMERVGWWEAPPEQPDAPILIVALEQVEEVERRLQDAYQTEYHGLRPGELLALYVQRELWEAYLRSIPGPALRSDATGPDGSPHTDEARDSH